MLLFSIHIYVHKRESVQHSYTLLCKVMIQHPRRLLTTLSTIAMTVNTNISPKPVILKPRCRAATYVYMYMVINAQNDIHAWDMNFSCNCLQTSFWKSNKTHVCHLHEYIMSHTICKTTLYTALENTRQV